MPPSSSTKPHRVSFAEAAFVAALLMWAPMRSYAMWGIALCPLLAAAQLDGRHEHTLAQVESLGFFSEPDSHWKRRKQIYANQIRRESKFGADATAKELRKSTTQGSAWWQVYFEPNFSCGLEERIGKAGDGGKWVCDPHKLRKEEGKEAPPCLVYSVGSNGEAHFEQHVHDDISSSCEIHTFDLNPWEYYTSAPGAPDTPMPEFMNYHVGAIGVSGLAYSLSPTHSGFKNWMANHHLGWVVGVDPVPDGHAKSVPDVVKELGHTGRTIDIFKIDCEGCEHDTVRHWFGAGVEIRQVLVEVHWKDEKTVREFHEFMQSMGYVVYHKETNTWGCKGECIEYGYLKLSTEFGSV